MLLMPTKGDLELDMARRYEIRLSGTGGQGVVLAGIILAEAAGRFQQGNYVVQTVSYGPQVRGGLSSAEVVISGEAIDYPKPIKLDLLVPFTQDAANAGPSLMKPRGLILQDPELVPRAPHGWVAAIPLSKLAREATGQDRMANIVSLGAISVLCPLLNPESVEAAVLERSPSGLKDVFLKAVQAGRTAAETLKDKIIYEEPPSQED